MTYVLVPPGMVHASQRKIILFCCLCHLFLIFIFFLTVKNVPANLALMKEAVLLVLVFVASVSTYLEDLSRPQRKLVEKQMSSNCDKYNFSTAWESCLALVGRTGRKICWSLLKFSV